MNTWSPGCTPKHLPWHWANHFSVLGSTLANLAEARHLIAVGPILSQPLPLHVPGAPRKGEWDERRQITQGMSGTHLGWDGSGLRSPAKDPDTPPIPHHAPLHHPLARVWLCLCLPHLNNSPISSTAAHRDVQNSERFLFCCWSVTTVIS